MGDSSFIRGVLIAQEGSSPEQMRQYQLRSEEALHANPAVDMTFTMTGKQRISSLEPGLVAGVSERPRQAAADPDVCRAVDGRRSTPGCPDFWRFFSRNPVLQISTGATANQQGQFAYSLSGIDPDQVYSSAEQADRQDAGVPGLLVCQLRSL